MELLLPGNGWEDGWRKMIMVLSGCNGNNHNNSGDCENNRNNVMIMMMA